MKITSILCVVCLSFVLLGRVGLAGSVADEEQRIDAEKQRESERREKYEEAHPGPIEELEAYMDAVFGKLRDRVSGALHRSDRSAKDLKESLAKLQTEVETEVKRQKTTAGKVTPEEAARRKKLLKKMREHLQALGDEVLAKVQKTADRLNQLSEEEDKATPAKPPEKKHRR